MRSTGAGGSGKTRVALHAAAECVDAFVDGVFWVPLAEDARAMWADYRDKYAAHIPAAPTARSPR